jgi:hypothetical protein
MSRFVKTALSFCFSVCFLSLVHAEALCPSGDIMACSRDAFAKDDFDRVYHLFMPKAREGDPEAQGLVGLMVMYGAGPEEAKTGSVDQLAHLAFPWLLAAARGDNRIGLDFVTFAFRHGRFGVERDPLRVDCLERAKKRLGPASDCLLGVDPP